MSITNTIYETDENEDSIVNIMCDPYKSANAFIKKQKNAFNIDLEYQSKKIMNFIKEYIIPLNEMFSIHDEIIRHEFIIQELSNGETIKPHKDIINLPKETRKKINQITPKSTIIRYLET